MISYFESMPQARAYAAKHSRREKAVCLVVHGRRLLVFGQVPDGGAGVQVPAGGVEAGETPEAAATRELWEETGLCLSGPQYLGSYLWEAQLPHRFTRQVCHAYAFAAPDGLPGAWQHGADGHLFAFRWADVTAPGLDWELDAALPWLLDRLNAADSLHFPLKENP